MTNTTTNTTPSNNVGKRVRITLTGHRYAGQLGTVVGESKKNFRVQLDGVKTVQTLAKPTETTPGCMGVRGRRPKAQSTK